MAIQKITTPIIGDAAVTTDKINNDFVTSVTTNPEFQGTSHIKVPSGTTAQRPASPAAGMIRYNTEAGALEQYTSLGWVSIASPPVISSVSPTTELGSDDPQQIVITGSNFDGAATATVFGNDGTQYTPTTSVRNSSTQITITFAGGDVLTGANEPYDVKVLNSTGLDTTLADAFNINDVPTWVTASGSLATVIEDEAMTPVTVSATDPESVGITYSVESGALPTGVSINSSTGSISGTPNVNDTYNSSGVVHNFTLGANDGAQTIDRAFSILRKWRDGSTSTLTGSSAAAIKSVTGTTTNGFYWIQTTGMSSPAQLWCDMNTGGGGWMRFWWYGKYEITGSDPTTSDWVIDRDLFSGTLESTYAYDSIRGFNHIPVGFSISGLMIKGNSPVQTKNGSELRYAIYNTTLTGNSTRNAILDSMQNQTEYTPGGRAVWAPTSDGTISGSASGWNNLLSGNYYNNGGPDWWGYSTAGSGAGSSSTSPYKSFNLDDDGGYGNQSFAAGNDSNGTPGVDFFSSDEVHSRSNNLVMYFK